MKCTIKRFAAVHPLNAIGEFPAAARCYYIHYDSAIFKSVATITQGLRYCARTHTISGAIANDFLKKFRFVRFCVNRALLCRSCTIRSIAKFYSHINIKV